MRHKCSYLDLYLIYIQIHALQQVNDTITICPEIICLGHSSQCTLIQLLIDYCQSHRYQGAINLSHKNIDIYFSKTNYILNQYITTAAMQRFEQKCYVSRFHHNATQMIFSGTNTTAVDG